MLIAVQNVLYCISIQSTMPSTILSAIQSTIQSTMQFTMQFTIQSTMQCTIQSTVQFTLQFTMHTNSGVHSGLKRRIWWGMGWRVNSCCGRPHTALWKTKVCRIQCFYQLWFRATEALLSKNHLKSFSPTHDFTEMQSKGNKLRSLEATLVWNYNSLTRLIINYSQG